VPLLFINQRVARKFLSQSYYVYVLHPSTLALKGCNDVLIKGGRDLLQHCY